MDAKRLLGKVIRFRREHLKLSQERVAEKANITYQYLSAIENGHENFSIGVLESISIALDFALPDLVNAAYQREYENLEASRISSNFLREVPLPPGLNLSLVEDALNETQRVIKLLNASLIRAGGRALPRACPRFRDFENEEDLQSTVTRSIWWVRLPERVFRA